ncbi:MAG: carbohydrate ABC transporter permease [Chloroflexota bacterium]
MATLDEPGTRSQGASGRRPLTALLSRKQLPYLLALPIVIYEGIFILYPMAVGVQYSLSDIEAGSTASNWVGFANYQRMFTDSTFWQSAKVTVEYSLAVIVIALAVALGTALLMNRTFKGRGIFRALLTTPWAFPDIPTTLIFVWMASPIYGVLGEMARWLPWVHNNPRWLLDPHLALATIVLISVWKGFPFYSLVILAALQGVPHELYEAAIVDGANAPTRFRYVTLPAIKPTLMLLALLAFIFSYQQYTLIWQTTGPGPLQTTQTLSILIYNEAFQFYDTAYASTIGVAGFVLSIMAALVFVFLERQARAAEER